MFGTFPVMLRMMPTCSASAPDVDTKLGVLSGGELLVIVKFVKVAGVDSALLKSSVIFGWAHHSTVPLVGSGSAS